MEKGVLKMKHDVNLNIHYSAPDEIWEKIGNIYSSMPYWAGNFVYQIIGG